MEYKVCSRCRKQLPVEFFNKNNNKSDGLRSECRFCYIKSRYNNSPKEDKVKPFRQCKMCHRTFSIATFPKDPNSYDGVSYFCKECHKAYDKAFVVLKKIVPHPSDNNNPNQYKVCNKCGRLLPLTMYSKDRTRPDGLNSRCKDCMSQYKKNKYDNEHPKKTKAKSKVDVNNISYENFMGNLSSNDILADELIEMERDESWSKYVDWDKIDETYLDIHPRLEYGVFKQEFTHNNYFMYNYVYCDGFDVNYPFFYYRDIRSSEMRFHDKIFHESQEQCELGRWMADTSKELEFIKKWGYAEDIVVELITFGELAERHDYIGIFAKNGSAFILDDEETLDDGLVNIYMEIVNDFHWYSAEITNIPPETKCIAWRKVKHEKPKEQEIVNNNTSECNLSQDELDFLLTPLK